jgi:hypothetical protein
MPNKVLLDSLLNLYGDPPDIIEQRVKAFVSSRPGIAATVNRLRHRSSDGSLTPETLMVLERLFTDRPRLLARWPASVPLRDLEVIAAEAGQPLVC